MCDFKPNKSSNEAARLDKKAVHTIEDILDQEDVHTNIECGGNTPNIDGWIELLDTENRITCKITVQIKHLPTGQCFYSIPQYICGYAERIKSEVIVFIACDPENRCFFWRVIDDVFIELFRNNSKGKHQSWRYYFKEEEYCNASKVRSTIDNWRSLYHKRISSIKDYRQLADSFAKCQRIPFYKIRSTFDCLSNSHIKRPQVEELLNWVEEPVSETHGNLCILQGHAGVGKSVVINDLIEKLDKKEITTLCIKADSLNMMSDEMQLDKLIDHIQYLKSDQRNLVVIIDQIDALSQYLTNDRDRINMFVTLISGLKDYRDVKIVVSCRKYDLEYDNNLKSLCHKAHFVDLGNLPLEDVKRVLEQLKTGLSKQIDSQTIELLQTAHLLNLFCLVYRRNSHFVKVNNAHHLYDEFWRLLTNKTPDKIEPSNAEAFLFMIAESALKQKTLSPIISVDSCGEKVLDYLASNNAIVKYNNSYTFFHQSFYEYTLARLYSQNGESFFEQIQKDFQGIEIRPMVKSVYEYEREHSLNQYSKDLQIIFNSKNIRLHIKLLVLSLIATSDTVYDCERKLISKIGIQDEKLLSYFLRGLRQDKWFTTLEDTVLPYVKSLTLQSELLYPITNYLSCASFKYPKEVFDSINQNEDNDVRSYMTNFVIRGHNDYRRTIVRNALLRSNLDFHFRINALTDALKTNQEFVLDETGKLVLDYLLRENDINNKHDAYLLVETLCKKLSDDYPEDYLAMFHRCFIEVIARKSKPQYLTKLTLNDVFGHHMADYDKKLFDIYLNSATL